MENDAPPTSIAVLEASVLMLMEVSNIIEVRKT